MLFERLHSTYPPSLLYTTRVRLRDESFGLNYSTNTPAVSHQGVPVSIFSTQGTVLLILTFKSLSLTFSAAAWTSISLQTGINLARVAISGP